jgi:hypothetical protein
MAGRTYGRRARRSSFANASATPLSFLEVIQRSYRLLRLPAVERATVPWDSRLAVDGVATVCGPLWKSGGHAQPG